MIPASSKLIEVNSLSRDEKYLYTIISALMSQLGIKTIHLCPADITKMWRECQFFQLDENAAWGISLTSLTPDEHSKFLLHLPEEYRPMGIGYEQK